MARGQQEAAVRRGYVPMLVGKGSEEEMERFLVHTKLFKHPHLVGLLDIAEEEFGHQQRGILRIPCDAEHFKVVLDAVLRAKS